MAEYFPQYMYPAGKYTGPLYRISKHYGCQIDFLNPRFYFCGPACCSVPRQSYIKNVKVVNFPLNCTSIFHSSDQGIIRPFRHYNSQQLVRKIISMIQHTFLHDGTLMTNILDALWNCGTVSCINGELLSEMWIYFKSKQR